MSGIKLIIVKYYRWIALCCFVILILSISGSDLIRLVDPLSLIVLGIGTFLLTVMTFNKSLTKIELYHLMIKNTIIVSVITFLIGFIISLSYGSEFTELIKMISVSLIVLVYALIVVSILKFMIVIEEGKNLEDSKGVQSNSSVDDEESNLLRQFYLNYKLTDREKQIIEMGLKGSTNKEIADQLFVSESTIKKQTTQLYKKVDVKSRYELIALYSKLKNESK